MFYFPGRKAPWIRNLSVDPLYSPFLFALKLHSVTHGAPEIASRVTTRPSIQRVRSTQEQRF